MLLHERLLSIYEELGIKHVFSIPGDYNLPYLDRLNQTETIQNIHCTNELNMGYMADGYARALGAACFVTTFSVGSLSAINAMAGSVAENVPVLHISFAPRSCETGLFRIMHHSIGRVDPFFVVRAFAQIGATSLQLNRKEMQIQLANVRRALKSYQCVYLEIPMDLMEYRLEEEVSSYKFGDEPCLEISIELLCELIPTSVLVLGHQCQSPDIRELVRSIVSATTSRVFYLPNAHGVVSTAQTAGMYWPGVTSTEEVDKAGRVIYIGCVFTDYNTSGFNHRFNQATDVFISHTDFSSPDATIRMIGGMFHALQMIKDVLSQKTTTTVVKKAQATERVAPRSGTLDRLIFDINDREKDEVGGIHVVVDTGTSWFTGLEIEMHSQDRFLMQMQYGSIGWSVCAAIGYALAVPDGRCICLVGDGAFQMTAQALSTADRYDVRNIDVVLINNGWYAIEEALHSGEFEYNRLPGWDYTKLAQALRFVKKRTKKTSALRAKSSERRFFNYKVAATDYPSGLEIWGQAMQKYTCEWRAETLSAGLKTEKHEL